MRLLITFCLLVLMQPTSGQDLIINLYGEPLNPDHEEKIEYRGIK